jgi:hypothetical protein
MIQGGLLQKEMHGAHTTLSLMIGDRRKSNRRHCFPGDSHWYFVSTGAILFSPLQKVVES